MHRLAAALLVAVFALSCVRNPVTGKRQLSLVSRDQEIAIGQQAKEETIQTIGLVQKPELQAYVASVGKKLAAASERPDLPWSFQVVDDASVNAFALPGGPVFVTRGILTHLNTEAELAIVMGHEVGHVTAKHAVSMLSKQQLAQVGLGIGSIFLPENLRGLGQLAGAGASLLFLKYGRDAERQSDELGFKYALKQGYDVREMKDVFTMLEKASGGAEGKLPEWLSTHPNTESRVETAQKLAKETPNLDQRNLVDRRAEYLRHLDGVVYGENPRAGYFQGNTFLHPDLAFQLQVPSGWKAQNMPQAVAAISPKQDAIVQLAPAGNVTPEQAAQQFFSQQGVKHGQVTAGTMNSLPATAGYFLADTEQGQLGGVVAFISHQGHTFGLIGYSPAQLLQQYDGAFRSFIGSFAPLTDPQALAVQPARVKIVTLPREMTVAEAYAAYPSTIPVDEFALINGHAKEERLPAGTMIKQVQGGTPAKTSVSSSEF